MTRLQRQRGSTLILVLGIVVTLGILATALVAVVANAQHNTLRERSQAKSFHVAEAALDAAMANISPQWPSGASATPVQFPTAAFQDEFRPDAGKLAEYPGSTGADVPDVTVTYFDNYDTNGDGVINQSDSQIDGDPNSVLNPPDDKMYIVVQAGVLDRASRIQVLVQRTYFQPEAPLGNVLWCGGNMDINGGGYGAMPKVTSDSSDPLNMVSADVVGNIANYDPDNPLKSSIDMNKVNAQFGTGPAGHDSPKSLDQAFPGRDAIIRVAMDAGRYFDADNASPGKTALQTAEASPKSTYGGPGLAGLTVVRQTSTPAAKVTLLGGDTLNAPPNQPGVLMLLGNLDFEIGGTAAFYGVLYVENGGVTVSHGTPSIHGSLILEKGDVLFAGNGQLVFSAAALSGGIFATSTPATVRMVPNTWRELQPQ